jgi:hypothetical protein
MTMGVVVRSRTLSTVETIVCVTSAAQFGSVNGLPAMARGYLVTISARHDHGLSRSRLVMIEPCQDEA